MESLSLDRHSPNSILLASDGSFSTPLNENDLVWALDLDSADTPLFSLNSTFGLRAKSIRLIPNFFWAGHRLLKSHDLKRLPTVTHFTTSTLKINCALNKDLEIQFNFFIPKPDILAGRIKITNLGNQYVDFSTEVAVTLIPMDQGQPTRPVKLGNSQIISGQAGNLYPVLFMNGGPAAISNPHPALLIPGQIPPKKSQNISWTLAAKTTRDASLEAAREVTAENWQITAQKQIMKHAKQSLYIRTGNPDWDAAFLLTQTNAMSHLVEPQPELSSPFFIRTRLPDQPSSIDQTPDALDDLTTLEANHLAQVFLPAQPELMARVVERFLSRINDQGRLLSRLNTSPFAPAYQECPLLSGLCLQIYEINQDETFLQRVFPSLTRLLGTWYSDHSNTNNVIIPTWENPQQCQLDTGLYNFDIWEPTGCGLDIQIAESPALAAMVYRDVKALNRIAEILNVKPDGPNFRKMERLTEVKMNQFWCEELNRYTYRDKQSHLCPTKTHISQGFTQKRVNISHEFSEPMRLQLHLHSADDRTRVCSVQFEGENAYGDPQIESFITQDIRWVKGMAHLTSQNLYTALHSVSFIGMNAKDRFNLETADLTQPDITCLLPIWSGGVSKNHINNLRKGPLDPQNPALHCGIPETWLGLHDLPDGLPVRVNVMWNSLIIEGLARAGFTQHAMQLFSTLMTTIVKGIKNYNGFFSCFDSLNGCPCGQRNAIAGLVPIRLFLEIAGIRLFTPSRIALWGTNPFPWPVDVHWQGLSLRRESKKTVIHFPDGTRFENETENPVVLTTDDHYETEHA